MPTPLDPTATAGGDASINTTVLDQAFEWLVVLWSGVATPQDHEACARWREAHADHERAWQQVQSIDRKLDVIRRDVGSQALKRPAASVSASRRRLLKGLAALAIGVAATYAVRRTATWQYYTADYRTRTGESRNI